jgi:hypothetical protein
MTIIKDPAPDVLVIGNIIYFIQGTFLCIMTEQTGLINNPVVGDYPDISFPGKIPDKQVQKPG